jgi:hypothetical protein
LKRKALSNPAEKSDFKRRNASTLNFESIADSVDTSSKHYFAGSGSKQLSILNFTKKLKMSDQIKASILSRAGGPSAASADAARSTLSMILKTRLRNRERKRKERALTKEEEVKLGKRDENGKLKERKKSQRVRWAIMNLIRSTKQ